MTGRDLDQGGFGFQRVRTYLGPSLGWVDELVQPSTRIVAGGTYNVQPGDSILLVDVTAPVVIQLPDVRTWVQQTANQPATGFERSITVKDFGGNANNFNIVIAPMGQQTLDDLQQALVMSVARSTVKLIPLIDLTGWIAEIASVGGGGGGSGGGDVFKAGNNTFTATNIFLGPIDVPTVPLTDNSLNAASTAWVKAQNYLVSVSLLPYAPLFSPAFTGLPTAPTPPPDANDSTIVTVGFVENALAAFTGGAPANAEYALGTANAGLPAGRVLTNTPSIVWDFSTPGQAKANSAAGGGNVSSAGTPAAGQYAKWTTVATIQGVSPATVLSDIGAQPAGSYQPLDGDLTALAGLTGTNTIYYRSATDIWSPVTFSGLTFSGGVLTSVGGGNVNSVPTPTAGQFAKWTDATHIQGVTLNPPNFTAAPSAPLTPSPGDLWYDLNTGVLSMWINDGSSSQWVMVSPGGGGVAPTGGFVKVQKFTANGTYTPTAGTQFAIVEAVGGGGGGGTASGSAAPHTFSGGGGGSGGYSRSVLIAAQIGASQVVTIGNAGAGGVTPNHNGSNGGDTSVGSLCIAKGGIGGGFGGPTLVPVGGAGGIVGTGDIVAAGAPGIGGTFATGGAAITAASQGGSSFFGGGATGVYPSGSGPTVGLPAGNYGSGGSGGLINNAGGDAAGGAGSPGIVIVTEYNISGLQGPQGTQGVMGPAGTIGAPRGWIDGLILSWVSNTSITVAIGQATDSISGNALIDSPTAITKTTAVWAVGSGLGGVDGGAAAASTWYHVHLIKRIDTGVVDVLLSTSLTPTLPTNYNQRRRIGAVRTNASAQFIQFSQFGDDFIWTTTIQDLAATAQGIGPTLRAVTVPTGVVVLWNGVLMCANPQNEVEMRATEPGRTAVGSLGWAAVGLEVGFVHPTVGVARLGGRFKAYTNTSSQISVQANDPGSNTMAINTIGWTDPRGRNA